MTKQLLVALLVILGLFSCKARTALNYSENFVKKERGLAPDIAKTESAVAKFVVAKQFDSIAAAGERMEKLIDVELQSITDTPPPDVEGVADFKSACIKYFAYLKSVYTGYKNLGNATSDEARQAELDKIVELSSRNQLVSNEIRAAQQKFASANNFRVENK